MLIADLVWEGVVVKTIPLQGFVPTIQICKPQEMPLSAMRDFTSPIPDEIVNVDIMQFEFRESSREIPSHLIYAFKKYVIRPSEIDDKPLNLGFAEPDEKVNLEHLKKKLKTGINLKNLLLRFYQK